MKKVSAYRHHAARHSRDITSPIPTARKLSVLAASAYDLLAHPTRMRCRPRISIRIHPVNWRLAEPAVNTLVMLLKREQCVCVCSDNAGGKVKFHTTMVSPKHAATVLRRGRSTNSPTYHRVATICVVSILIVLILLYVRSSLKTARGNATGGREKHNVRLLIAIGSKPSNVELRNAAREGWLRWMRKGDVAYIFFSDVEGRKELLKEQQEVCTFSHKLETKQRGKISEITRTRWCTSLLLQKLDMVLMPIEGGYGTKENNSFLARALFQLSHALDHYNFDYMLRIDDDTFLCLHRLLYELDSYPTSQFFMGR